MQIAVYGKGGIGKSTISANLSAALSYSGKHVLQIGCDPKHDSTRLLHHGRKVTTVLDYLLNTPKDEQVLEGVLMYGYGDTGCVEAGGPKPGMGCAGRGILTAFEFLNHYQFRKNYDTVVYDVLGDVVCGGFAVPVRSQYADAVFLVTSGERMAIYAANNNLQGIYNLNPDEKRIAGIIYNSRGIGDDRSRVEAFAKAVGLPICISVPRSAMFSEAENKAQTLIEMAPDSMEAQLFLKLADKIKKGLALYPSNPLGEEEMERFMQGGSIAVAVSAKVSHRREVDENKSKSPAVPIAAKKRALSDPFSRIPLFGCAFNGAVALAIHVKDAAVLAHAPKSCVWYSMNGFTGYSRRGLYDRGILYPAFIPQYFDSTDMTTQDAIYGGVANAREHALALVEKGVRTIIAITACIPGMSGDDLEPIREELAEKGVEMVIIKTDGIAVGDYNEGMAYCYRVLAEKCVRRDQMPEKDTINLVYEKTWSSKTDQNFMIMNQIFQQLGIRVNCRFVCASSMEDIHNFQRGRYSLLVQDDALGQEIKNTFISEYGTEFLPDRFPKGFSETVDFVRMLGRYYQKEAQAEQLIQKQKVIYQQRLAELKKTFQDRKTIIFINGGDFDWVFELAKDIGLDTVKIIHLGSTRMTNAGWNRRFSEKWESDRSALKKSIMEYEPEMVLLNDFSALAEIPDGVKVINLMRESEVGFFSDLNMARNWEMTMENELEGDWKNDKSLFEKYYC